MLDNGRVSANDLFDKNKGSLGINEHTETDIVIGNKLFCGILFSVLLSIYVLNIQIKIY